MNTGSPQGKGLKLWQLGLLIVSIPLVFEIAFVAILAALLNQAEVDIKREYHAKLVMVETQTLGSAYYDAVALLVARASGQGFDVDQRFNATVKQIRSKLDLLRQLTTQSQVEGELIRKIVLLSDEELQILVDVNLKMASGGRDGLFVEPTSEMRKRAENILGELTVELRNLREVELRVSHSSPEITGRSRQTIQIWLMVGVVFNVVIAVLISLFFSSRLVRRVAVIADNSKRLLESRELQSPLSGADEIAFLDRVFHDMAAALREAARKERALQELKQQFVSMISHELRTPLTSIQSNLKLMTVGALGELPEKVKLRAETTSRNCERLIALINELLDVEKLESGKMTMEFHQIPLKPALERSAEALERIAEEREVRLEMPATTEEVYADEDRIVQVLINLISNAIKYSPEHGVIRTSVLNLGDFIEVRVQDEGKGIPDQMKDAIFDRFRQVEIADSTKKGGSGLGLAICKAIVEQHGGSIGVESNEGPGSTFWFQIPARERGDSAQRESEGRASVV